MGRGARGESPTGCSEIVATAGPHAILNTHYTGTFALLAYVFPLRFFNRLGATEVDPDTICNKAGHVALEYVYGTSVRRFRPGDRARFGLHPRLGRKPFGLGAARRTSTGCRKRRAAVIVVDPVRTPTAEQRADLHLQPFPGSDAALAFALLHVIAREGLVDRDVRRATTRSAGTSSSRCSPTARRRGANRVTGVPAAVDRGGGAPLRPRPVAPVARPGPPAPAHRRERRARLRAPPGGDRQPRPARHRLPLSQRRRVPRDRRGLPGRSAPRRCGAAADQPHGPRRLPRGPGPVARRSSAGTSTSLPQIRSRRACTQRLRARTCSPSRSTSSRRTRPTSPTTSCRRRASSSSTISWSRTST